MRNEGAVRSILSPRPRHWSCFVFQFIFGTFSSWDDAAIYHEVAPYSHNDGGLAWYTTSCAMGFYNL